MRTILFCFLLTSVALTASAQVFEEDPTTGYRQVESRLNKYGWAHVIVKLEMADYEPEGRFTDRGSRQSQRARIGQLQSSLISGLDPKHIRVKRRYKLLPYVALEVSRAGLEQLKNSPFAALISADIVGEAAAGASPLRVDDMLSASESPTSSVPAPTAESSLVVGADVANANGCDGSGWAIAILDSGIQNDHASLVGRVTHEACFSTHSPGSDQYSMCPNSATDTTGTDTGDDCTPCRDRDPFNGPGPFTYDPPDCDFWPPVQVACPHGTLITGPAAGDGGGVVGIAPEADVIAIRVMTKYENTCLQTEGDGDLVWERGCPLVNASDLMAGIEHVAELAHSVDIAALNISIDMTGAPGAPGLQTSECDGVAALSGIKDAVDVTNSYGIPTTAATGNSDWGDRMIPPACLSNVISVAYTQDGSSHTTGQGLQTTEVDSIGKEPNRASFLDFWAPGEWITSGWPHDPLETSRTTRGTSLAAPQVAAAFAALRSKGGARGIDYYRMLLDSTGVMVTDNKTSKPGGISGITKPRIDVGAACLAMSVLKVNVTALLEGPYAGGGMMSTGAIFQDSLPTMQPFGGSLYSGTVLENPNVDAVPSIPNDIVDWVMIGLRTDTAAASTVVERPALIRTDGSVVDFDGTSPVHFLGVDSTSYFVVLRHRNHGDVMSSSKVNLTTGAGTWNFTANMSKAYTTGPNPMKEVDSRFMLFGGDINIDAQTNVADFADWLVQTKAALFGYRSADLTLNGHVTVEDFAIWLANTKAALASQVPD